MSDHVDVIAEIEACLATNPDGILDPMVDRGLAGLHHWRHAWAAARRTELEAGVQLLERLGADEATLQRVRDELELAEFHVVVAATTPRIRAPFEGEEV